MFISENTKTLRQAEEKAKEIGLDTLIWISKCGPVCGRSKEGIWSIGLPLDISRIANAINYEESMDRTVGIWSEDSNNINFIVDKLDNIEVPIYPKGDKFLCHSTTVESMIEILKDGELKSLDLLSKEGKVIKTIRNKLVEPEESTTYIDFCTPESLSSEMVVASRQYEDIFSMKNIKYKPGVRMYFSLEGLLLNENKVVDGLHTLRIKDRLSLNYVKYIVFSTEDDLNKAKPFMNYEIQNKSLVFNIKDKVELNEFVRKANTLVEMMEILKLNKIKGINMINFINTYGVEVANIIESGLRIKAKSDVYRNYILPKDEENFQEILKTMGKDEKAFCVFNDWVKNKVIKSGEIEWVISCKKYYFPIDKNIEVNKKFDIRRLHRDEAEYIHYNYEFRDYIALEYIKERVDKEVSFGIYENNVLVGWVLTHDDGAIGLLNVMKEYRNKGYGEAVVRIIVKELLKKKKLPFAHIEDYNEVSLNLFKRVGMIEEGEIHWIKLK